LGALFGPDEGHRRLQAADGGTDGSAAPIGGTQQAFGEALRDLGGDGSAPPLLPAMAIVLFLAASVLALMREARRSI
jgi:hypothetical protein